MRLFRNNTGTLYDRQGRPVTFGLAKGSADLIGWTTRTITPDMVGQTVAVFTSLEVKTATGRVSTEQRQWLDAVQAAGGVAGVVRSVEDAQTLLTGADHVATVAASGREPDPHCDLNCDLQRASAHH